MLHGNFTSIGCTSNLKGNLLKFFGRSLKNILHRLSSSYTSHRVLYFVSFKQQYRCLQIYSWNFNSLFVLKTTNTPVFIFITEILWQTFWRNKWWSVFDVVKDSSYCDQIAMKVFCIWPSLKFRLQSYLNAYFRKNS